MKRNENDARHVELEPILEELSGNGIGKFQIRNYAYLMFPVALTAFFTTSYVFTAADDPHRCLISECESPNTTEFTPNWLKAGSFLSDSCHRRISENISDIWQENRCDIEALTDKIEGCKDWVYRDRLSIVSEFNLGCADWKRTTVGTANNIGQLVCMSLTGVISDRWGRRTVLALAGTASAVLGILRSFSFDYVSFLALEFLEPAIGAGVYSSAFILAVELVDPRKRVLGGAVIAAYYSVGETILALVAWLVPYWRYFLRVTYAPGLLLVTYFWLIPESIRWLLAEGRYAEAEQQLRKAAKINKVNLSDKCLVDLQYNVAKEQEFLAKKIERKKLTSINENEDRKETYLDVIRTPKLLIRLLCCSWMWITCALLYYGLSLGAVTLTGDKYINFFLVSLIELPAHAACLPALAYAGRKPVLASCYLLGGAACLMIPLVPENLSWLQMFLFLGGKFCITAAFTIIYMFTTELFPTSLRHSMLSTCSLFGRLGSISAPQMPLLAKLGAFLPYVVFGLSALIAGILVLCCPETKGVPLPDTIQESLDLQRRRSLVYDETSKGKSTRL